MALSQGLISWEPLCISFVNLHSFQKIMHMLLPSGGSLSLTQTRSKARSLNNSNSQCKILCVPDIRGFIEDPVTNNNMEVAVYVLLGGIYTDNEDKIQYYGGDEIEAVCRKVHRDNWQTWFASWKELLHYNSTAIYFRAFFFFFPPESAFFVSACVTPT
jgi:hypothetical protein